MYRSINTFLSKFVFSVVLIYVLLLGISNLMLAYMRPTIENYLSDLLNAQKVNIGYVANLPFVFVNTTEIKLVVNDELQLEISDIRFFYRFWYVLTNQYEKIPGTLRLETITFNGHIVEINKYIDQLTEKFASIRQRPIQNSSEIDLNRLFESLDYSVNIKQIRVQINAMEEFWNNLDIDNFNLIQRNGAVSWQVDTRVNTVWSNTVNIFNLDIRSQGTLSNLMSMPVIITTNTLRQLNLGGINFVKTNTMIDVSFVDNILNAEILNPENAYFNFDNNPTNNYINFKVNAPVPLQYNEFEEFQLLDYAFKPAEWELGIDVQKTSVWNIIATFTSDAFPEEGLYLEMNPVGRGYLMDLSLKTHYFGSVTGELDFANRPNLYPLPSGHLDLNNVRFVLNGLVFSGQAIADAVPNENQIELTAFNVKMNDGLIGNTSALFDFKPNGDFIISPLPLAGSAVDVFAHIGNQICVQLDAFDVDGDFVAKNTKLAVFGLPDSRYKGLITMFKKSRNAPFILNAQVDGLLDSEPQISGIFSLTNDTVYVDRFQFIGQDIMLRGIIGIEDNLSNTLININGQGQFRDLDSMPIDIVVDIQKNDAIVRGQVDRSVTVNTITTNDITDMKIYFSRYSLSKLGLNAGLTGGLFMQFDENGITRFNINEANLNAADHNFYLDFESAYEADLSTLESNITNTLDYTNTIDNQRPLQTTNFTLGFDREVYQGQGFFTFDDLITAAIAFDQGGGLQYAIGRYIVKSHINIPNLIVDNLFQEEFLAPLSFLDGVESETVLASADVFVEGLWSDLAYKGSLYIRGIDFPQFQINLPQFTVSSAVTSLSNLQIRHSIVNLDTSLVYTNLEDLNIQEVNANGTFALTTQLRSKFNLSMSKTNDIAIYDYNFPTLYFLSRVPTSIGGKVLQLGSDYLITSTNVNQGVSGSMKALENGFRWDINMLSEGVKVFSAGYYTNEIADASFNMDLLLDRLALSAGISRARGGIKLNTRVQGTLDSVLVNGAMKMRDIELNTSIIGNRLLLKGEQQILISNTQFIFPRLEIESRGGGLFTLDGVLATGDDELGTTDLRFYSSNPNGERSYLNIDLDFPFFTFISRTYIDYINLSRNGENLALSSNIDLENSLISINLDDTLADTDSDENNPALQLASALDLDVFINLTQRTRVNNQLINLELKEVNPIRISGNVGDNTVVIEGELEADRGNITYLNTDLNVVDGTVIFSGDIGDPYPQVVLNTESLQRAIRNEQVDLFVDFEGKLPNLELSQITSNPSKTRSELFSILGFGVEANSPVSIQNPNSATDDLIAGSVGVVENAFFISPLTRRLQRLLPFIDVFELRTDVLGNLTRSASSGNGSLSGISIFNGSELKLGYYIPRWQGAQINYSLQLGTFGNSLLESTSLDRLHAVGLEWRTTLTRFNNLQLGAGVNIEVEERAGDISQNQVGFVLEGSLRQRF